MLRSLWLTCLCPGGLVDFMNLCTGVYSRLAFVLEVLDDLVHGYASISCILHISHQFVLYGGQHCTHSRHPVRESETRACGNQLYSSVCTEHYENVLQFFSLCNLSLNTVSVSVCVCVCVLSLIHISEPTRQS